MKARDRRIEVLALLKMGFQYRDILEMNEEEKEGYFSVFDEIMNGGRKKLPVKRP